MPSTCIVCKKTGKKERDVSVHRFPPETDPAKRQVWLAALDLKEDEVHDHHRVCSRHFPSGDVSQTPSLHLGK